MNAWYTRPAKRRSMKRSKPLHNARMIDKFNVGIEAEPNEDVLLTIDAPYRFW